MSEEIKGIESIKEVLGTLLDVGIDGYQAYADDGKIDTKEIIQLAFKAPKIWSAVKETPEAIAEGKDLDPEELEDLMNFIFEKLSKLGVKV